MSSHRPFRVVAVLAAFLAVVAPVLAQDSADGGGADKKSWSDTAELSLVGTEGNSETLTVGFKNVFKKRWTGSRLEVVASGIRTETTEITRRFFDDPNNPSTPPTEFQKTEDTRTTAETYLFRTRYDRDITERFFWYTGVSWDRNIPAGIQNRYLAIGGVGNIWRDTDTLRFKTDYAVTYTDQEDVVDAAMVDETFAGLRFSWDYFNQLTETTKFENTLVIDQNLDETDDRRASLSSGLTVSISSSLALKAGLDFLYDAEPAFESVQVFNINDRSQPIPGRTVPVQLDELDTILSVSLVVNF